MTELEKLKLHLSNLIVKEQQDVVLNVNWLLKILEDINKGQGTISKLINNDSVFNNLNDASKSIDLLLEDIRLNPSRYIHFSIFGKKNKPYKTP